MVFAPMPPPSFPSLYHFHPPFLIFFLYFQLFKNLKVICCATQKVVVVWILPLCGYSLIH